MLLGDFYKVEDLTGVSQEDSGTIACAIDINRSHGILAGHFPGIPVVPGVCMLQMIKEIVELRLGKRYLIHFADQVKFLAVINPNEISRVLTEIQYRTSAGKETEIAARLYSGTVTFFKLKARLTEVSP